MMSRMPANVPPAIRMVCMSYALKKPVSSLAAGAAIVTVASPPPMSAVSRPLSCLDRPLNVWLVSIGLGLDASTSLGVSITFFVTVRGAFAASGSGAALIGSPTVPPSAINSPVFSQAVCWAAVIVSHSSGRVRVRGIGLGSGLGVGAAGAGSALIGV